MTEKEEGEASCGQKRSKQKQRTQKRNWCFTDFLSVGLLEAFSTIIVIVGRTPRRMC